jgi:hypothetical protein
MIKAKITTCAVGGEPITATQVSQDRRLTWREVKQLRIQHRQLVRAIRKNLILEVEVLLTAC